MRRRCLPSIPLKIKLSILNAPPLSACFQPHILGIHWTSRKSGAANEDGSGRETGQPDSKPSGRPYWRTIDEGLHLGYRKGRTAGKWVIRRYLGGEDYETRTFAIADDRQPADGACILTFNQAQARARELAAN